MSEMKHERTREREREREGKGKEQRGFFRADRARNFRDTAELYVSFTSFADVKLFYGVAGTL